jgi:hypothetical protein
VIAERLHIRCTLSEVVGIIRRVEREIFIVRDGAVVWRGIIRPPTKAGAPASTLDYFQHAWMRALQESAVQERDAALVQFRLSKP